MWLETWHAPPGDRSRTTRASRYYLPRRRGATAPTPAGRCSPPRLGRLVGQRHLRLPPLPLDLARGARGGGRHGPPRARRPTRAGPSTSPPGDVLVLPGRHRATAARQPPDGFTVVGAYPAGPGGLRPPARRRPAGGGGRARAHRRPRFRRRRTPWVARGSAPGPRPRRPEPSGVGRTSASALTGARPALLTVAPASGTLSMAEITCSNEGSTAAARQTVGQRAAETRRSS